MLLLRLCAFTSWCFSSRSPGLLVMGVLAACHAQPPAVERAEPVAGPRAAEASPSKPGPGAAASAEPAATPIVEPAPAPIVEPAVPGVQAPEVVDHLLPWTAERAALTHAYLLAHRTTPPGDDAANNLNPKVIVLHWTAGPTAASAWSTFAPARLAGRAELAGAGELNVGAHYLVDRDGRIERLAAEHQVMRHCIGLNHVAIGIENVGSDPQWPLTDAQVAANVALVRWIAARHPIERLIGHLEYQALDGTSLFEEQDPKYRTQKPDPGAAFMVRVRAEVQDLGLRGGR